MAAALETLLQDWRERLRAWSADGSLASAARHALELEGEQPLLDELVAQWAAGDFSLLPPITLLPASSMPGAAGAYSISTGTIYLNQDWIERASNERLTAVLTEELGHHLDAWVNPGDTPGDEGELISRLLFRTDLGADHNQAISHEHDQIQILVDGEWITAEASGLPAPFTPDLTSASDTGSSDTDNLTNNPTPTFTGTAEPGATVELFADDQILGTTSADTEGNWKLTVPAQSALSNGSYAIKAQAIQEITRAPQFERKTIGSANAGRTIYENRNIGAFAALKEDGSVVTWGRHEYGGNSQNVREELQEGVKQVFSTNRAFAALKMDGSVVTWGAFESDSWGNYGGDSSSVESQLRTGVSRIYSTTGAFAALKNDGSVIAWGNFELGGDASAVAIELQENIAKIFSNEYSFAALRDDGSVITWGDSYWGGDSSSVKNDLQSGTTQIFSTIGAFAAVKNDGSVVTWGHSSLGGDSSSVASQLQAGVTQIFSTIGAFAAVKNDGSVVTWGQSSNGGDSSSVASKLQSGVTQIFSSYYAFAALKDDGSVVTWGDSESGGDSSSVSSQLRSGIAQIFSTGNAFAALKTDGSVVTWGNSSLGGDSSSVASKLQSGVTQIFSTIGAFAAVKDDGSVVTWGDRRFGGYSALVKDYLGDGVVHISTNSGTFAALKSNGSVVAWGTSSSSLQSGVVSFSDPFYDDNLIAASFKILETSDLSQALALTIDITAPLFSSGSTAAAIDENTGAGQIVYTAKASEQTALSYSLKTATGDSDSFSIKPDSGAVTLTTDPNYEIQSSYEFTVVATDQAGNKTEQAVTLAINDLDETPPAPPSTPDLKAASDTGASDTDNLTADPRPTFTGTAEPGSTINLLMDGVLYPANTAVTTADPVTGEWSYTIPDEDAATEDITSSLTVTATDGAGNTSDESDPLVITIDLSPPVFVSGPTADPINENSGSGQVVYVAKASDTHAVQYALKKDNGGDADIFAIDASTGDVTLTIDPDYETQASYAFTVIATDAAGNTAEQLVTLTINNLPETQTHTVQLSIPSLSIQAGKSVAIPITIDDAAGIESLDLNLTYDPEIFSAPQSGSIITTGTLNPGAAFVVNDSPPGQLLLSWSTTNPLASGSGSIAILNLDVKPDASPGTTTLLDLVSASVNERRIGSELTDGTVTVLPPSFQITNVRHMPNGLALRLPEAPDMDVFNLYDGPEDAAVDQPDLALTNAAGTAVALSAHWQPSTNELLLLAAEPLADGDYTLTVDSRSDGLVSASSGELLDGNGTPGTAFSYSFSHTAPELALSILDTARGAGQALSLNGVDPVTGQPLPSGIPILLSSTSALTSLSGSLRYDQNLLLNGTLNTGADLPDDWSVLVDPGSAAGQLLYSASGTTAISGTDLELFRFDAIVSATAAPKASANLYGSTTLIEATATANTSLEVETDPGLVALAYSGDTTGNGTLSSLDASRVQRVVVALDSGFEAYDDLNPVLIGDTTGNGGLSSLDASRIQQQVVRLEVNSFPALPSVA